MLILYQCLLRIIILVFKELKFLWILCSLLLRIPFEKLKNPRNFFITFIAQILSWIFSIFPPTIWNHIIAAWSLIVNSSLEDFILWFYKIWMQLKLLCWMNSGSILIHWRLSSFKHLYFIICLIISCVSNEKHH